MITFKNLTKKNSIGANSYLIDTGNCKIILDSGMHPKEEGEDAIPAINEIEPDTVDIVILTHSHLDHAGTIPLVMKRHPNATLYSTPPTADLADALMHNSVNVMQSKREELGITDYPLFGHRELDRLDKRWQTLNYERSLEIADDVYITFYNAGHILGSAGVLIEAHGKRIFYTGDIQFNDQGLLKGAEFPTDSIDTLIVETTRGSSPRDPEYSREKEKEKLCTAIQEALNKGGSALIPVFAIGKTQEVLTMIHEFKSKHKIPAKTPVFIGGLSTKMTMIYDSYAGTPFQKNDGFEIIEEMKLSISKKGKKRRPIVYQKRAIFALSSGMMTEKTVSNDFARTFINNAKNSLLFVGYTDSESPGARLKAANKGDMVSLDPEKEDVVFNCDRKEFDFSGHSSRDDILDYITEVHAKQCFLVHGDPEASKWFQEQITKKQSDTFVTLPEPCKDYTISE